ncbi:sugar ABC transporter substrate-binding protein [Streptomyces mashuensis]|uniref:Sugar ABC transporter substrate-binding protein n=1 Tax=Streptomyces mashuensis TaxID=33904 RepID=A0A919EEX9_9ACTN|nr:substrate-binding domain-containing protein [Streptomyces mashuensis]GHF58489.1 sugar ABC transporter substrate-binding protein [Streptomyces mashuensis]
MHARRRSRPGGRAAAVALVLAAALVPGCERGASNGAAPSPGGPAGPGCPAALARAEDAVRRAVRPDPAWHGPVRGPAAVPGKDLVVVAQTMTNPGVAGVAGGVREAAGAIGWGVRVVDGQGTPAGIEAAFGEALALRPAGIVVAGFDPRLTSRQVTQAAERRIPLVGWHAVDAPGPSTAPRLFTNVTTRVEDVARISADWIVAHARGSAGVVVFTDASVPFARHKSGLIERELATCAGVRLLDVENIPLPDTSSRTPQAVASLLSRFGRRWTHSVAINDVYFADAAPALRAARRKGAGAPYNIGAGDGDPSAFQRIRDRQFQAATVPEPLSEQGWQIVDEFNRAFSGAPASGYVAPVHLTTTDDVDGASSWDPPGYRAAYRRIWRAGTGD